MFDGNDGFLENTSTNALAAFVYHSASARDWGKTILRGRLESANTKILKCDGFEVVLMPTSELVCRCHSLPPSSCHQDGETVQLTRVVGTPYLTVRKRKDQHGTTE